MVVGLQKKNGQSSWDTQHPYFLGISLFFFTAFWAYERYLGQPVSPFLAVLPVEDGLRLLDLNLNAFQGEVWVLYQKKLLWRGYCTSKKS